MDDTSLEGCHVLSAATERRWFTPNRSAPPTRCDARSLPFEISLLDFTRRTCSIVMDVVKAVETYITRLVSAPSAMKVLLLDAHTVRLGRLLTFPYINLAWLCQTPIVSLASTQSTLLSHQVYLTDRIDNRLRNPMPHMKCVCFLQPSEASIEAVCAELREPKYGEYYLCQCVNSFGKPISELTLVNRLDFSSILSKSLIERLAEVDELEVVREVQVG